MTTFSPALDVAAAVGCAIVLWTLAITAGHYRALPTRVAYPKNYGDGEEQRLPKVVVWLMPAIQIAAACLIAWAIPLRLAKTAGTHADALTGLIIGDIVLFVLFVVQRNVMLRPDDV